MHGNMDYNDRAVREEALEVLLMKEKVASLRFVV